MYPSPDNLLDGVLVVACSGDVVLNRCLPCVCHVYCLFLNRGNLLEIGCNVYSHFNEASVLV
jgi:hypothetical protein